MKRLLLIFLSLLTLMSLWASDARNIKFVYIAHDIETPIRELKNKLDQHRNRALQDPYYQVIFYLANQGRPIIVQINPIEYNDDDYKALIQELYERDYHNPQPDVDLEYIVDLFQNLEIGINDLMVNELSMEFFVTPDFFTQGFNETVIARLYYVLALDDLHSENKVENFTLEVFYPEGNEPKYSKEDPFGPMNLGYINDKWNNSLAPMK